MIIYCDLRNIMYCQSYSRLYWLPQDLSLTIYQHAPCKHKHQYLTMCSTIACQLCLCTHAQKINSRKLAFKTRFCKMNAFLCTTNHFICVNCSTVLFVLDSWIWKSFLHLCRLQGLMRIQSLTAATDQLETIMH